MQEQYYVGIDWATVENEVCLLDADGEVVGSKSFVNSGPGVQELADWLLGKTQSGPANVLVAIEVPHGIVAEGLLERGFQIYSINPKQADRFRDRFSVAGAKDDRLDARVLADSLRTDQRCFRKVTADPARIIQLRGFSRMYEDLQKQRNGVCNRLREELRRYYPAFLRLGDVDTGWLLEIWDRAPSPEAAKCLREKTVASILKKHRVRRLTTSDVKGILSEAGPIVVPGTKEAAISSIRLLRTQLRLIQEQIAYCSKQMEELLAGDDETETEGCTNQQNDAVLLQTMPGIGPRIAAILLAEGTHALRERDYHKLRALGGAAPITRRSGKKVIILMRRACNPRLRNGLHHMASCAIQHDPHWKAMYAGMRARGHSYGRALRGVSDRMLKIICAMLATGEAYDPLRLGSAQHLAA